MRAEEPQSAADLLSSFGLDVFTQGHHSMRLSDVSMTFVEMDMASLASVEAAAIQKFRHNRLDLLICCGGIMAHHAALSKDGFEIQFAVNYLAHAMLVQQFLPLLSKTAKLPNDDVRIVNVTSDGWAGHPRAGISFDTLKTTQDGFLGPWIRYGQSKLANIIHAAELARRYPEITSVSVHPGMATTNLVNNLSGSRKDFTYVSNWIQF